MHLTPFAPPHLPDLTRLINAQIAPIPPHWTLTESQVAAILQKPSLWEIHYADEQPPEWRNEILCVVENDHVLAAARFDYRYDDHQLAMASGRWLVAEPGQPAALHLLLDYLKAKRTSDNIEILVNGRTDFGIGWGGIPTTDTHLVQTLSDQGFIPFQKWLVMTADVTHLANAPPPSVNLDHLRQEWSIDESHLKWDVNIYDGETLIGECQSWGIPPEFATCPDYDHWMEIEWLGIDEPYRRRGLARRMMIEQFRYHVARGKRYCFAYTSTDNTATINLNTSLGFTTQAEVWGWSWPYKL